uniref:Anterior gradient 1 n=1 Tax=Myripristis murdjan TaxID=586833 RepID=A0A667Z7Q3_9TELE
MPRWFLYLLLLTCARVVALNKEKVKPQKVKALSFLLIGWGDNITWAQTYEEALSKMIESQKPLMVIHHQEDCPHSQALKKVFAVSKSIQKMAKEDFIMLNLVHETIDKNLAPDGNYVPRILFVDPSMTVRTDIIGRYSNHLYTYEPKDLVLCEWPFTISNEGLGERGNEEYTDRQQL